jgi:hypothetical protein
MGNPTSFQEAYIGQLRSLVRQSPVRRKIIFLLMKKDYLTISELQAELERRGDKFNYRTIWQHVLSLQNLTVTVTEKDEHKAGKPVIVSLNDLIKNNKERIKKGLIEDYPHDKISEEEKKKYL